MYYIHRWVLHTLHVSSMEFGHTHMTCIYINQWIFDTHYMYVNYKSMDFAHTLIYIYIYINGVYTHVYISQSSTHTLHIIYIYIGGVWTHIAHIQSKQVIEHDQ